MAGARWLGSSQGLNTTKPDGYPPWLVSGWDIPMAVNAKMEVSRFREKHRGLFMVDVSWQISIISSWISHEKLQV